MLRELDCAVIEALHKARENGGFPQFDSVKGVFGKGRNCTPMLVSAKKTTFKSVSETQIALKEFSFQGILTKITPWFKSTML